jgi:hypothetical protein
MLDLLPRMTSSTGERGLLTAAVDWAMGRDGPKPSPYLVSTALGWSVLALRWHLRMGLETIWCGFGRLIARHRPRGTSARTYARLVLDAAKGDNPWNPLPDQGIGRVIENLGDALGIEMVGHDVCRTHVLVAPERAMLAAAVLVAAVCDRLSRLPNLPSDVAKFLAYGEPDRVSLSGVLRRFDPTMQLIDWLAFLIERYAIAQHLLTGARKASTGIDGFFFEPSDYGYVLLRADPWSPDAGPTKLPSAFRMLGDLNLLVPSGDRFIVTAEGEAVRDACEALANS